MKLRLLLKTLRGLGYKLKRHGGNHDIWTNGKIDLIITRHPDVNERLAKNLIKKAEKNKV